MIYKFLNTIIDDLFAFIITMPTLYRLSCFKDGNFYIIIDVIFIIYIYQRWIYKVDKTRTVIIYILRIKVIKKFKKFKIFKIQFKKIKMKQN